MPIPGEEYGIPKTSKGWGWSGGQWTYNGQPVPAGPTSTRGVTYDPLKDPVLQGAGIFPKGPLQLMRWPEEWGAMPESPWHRPAVSPQMMAQPQMITSPTGWQMTPDFSMFISPEGQQMTLAEVQTQIGYMGFGGAVYDYSRDMFVPATTEQVMVRQEQYEVQEAQLREIGEPGFIGPPGTPGAISIEEYESRISEYNVMLGEQREALSSAFTTVFPGQSIEDFFAMVGSMVISDDMSPEEIARADELQADFLETIREVGRTPDTEFLLRTVFPSASEEDLNILFGVRIEQPIPSQEPKAVFMPLVGVIKQMSAEEKEAAPTWVKSFALGLGDVYSSVAGASRWLGFDSIGEGLSKEAERLHREYAFPDTMGDFEFADLMNPTFYEEKVVRAIPFALSLAPLAVGGYFAGAAVAGAAGLGTIWTAVVGGLTGAALSRPLESAMEAGNQYDDAIARGKTEQEAKGEADEVFRNNMVLAGADAWEIAIALAPTPKWVPTSLVKGGLVRTARIGGKMVIVGLSEGGEEIYQDLIQRRARGEDWQWDPVSKEVFAIGMVMGLGMGLGGDVITSVVRRSKENMSPPQKKGFDTVVADFVAEGFTTEQAELRAMDRFAETQEGQKIVADVIKSVKEEPVAVPKGIPTVELRPMEAKPGEGYEIVVNNNVVGELDFRSTESLGIEGNMLVDIEVFPETKRRGIATQALDKLMLISEEQKRPLYSGLLKPEGELWLKGLEKRGVIKLEKQDQKLLGYLITRPTAIPKVAKPTIPLVKPEVFMTKEQWAGMSEQARAKALAESGLDRKLSSKAWGELSLYQREALTGEVPAMEEVAPERVVYSEGGVPVSPNEPIPQGVVENMPIIKDIGVKERWFRPTRKVFERMGLYETYKGIQKAEVELGEAKKAFGEKLREVSKLVDKSRRHLVFGELENPGSQVGLTFNEKRAVNFFRENFNKWADVLNLSQEKRIKNYITHIFEADIEAQLKAEPRLDPTTARALEYVAPKTIFNPFLQERLGVTTGLIEDPFAAASAYESRQLRVLYYEPHLQKIAVVANDPNTPQVARDYLLDYSRRMTKQPSKLDQSINNTLQEFAGMIEKLPGGKPFASFLSRGNPSGLVAYQFTGVIYTLWLGFKPTSAIRNLSQHTLILGEVGPVHFAKGIGLRFTEEGKAALGESLVLRSRKAAFVPGIDDSFVDKWTDKFRESALWMFRMADKQNVSDAFLAGYSEAKSLLPNADRQVWINRGDEVAADTQYLYTQMNSMSISQSSAGRVFSILTTWSENWLELMSKWIAKRPSQVYKQYEKETGKKVAGANWSTSYKAILMYMVIIGLGYALKERERLKAWEYTGITSIRYLADVAGGDFPGLQGPGAIANMIAGFLTDDERMLKTGWNEFKGTFTPGIVRQIQAVASGDRDWLTLFFYLEGRDFHIKKLKNKWEKGWKDYDAIEKAKERTQYREDNPLIEAQMFITSKFTTLSTEEARQEVLRLIEEHDLDVEFIDGYDKVFGVDTDERFTEFKKLLGEVELTEEGEQKLKENGELDYYTTSNFASDVNKLEGVVGRYKIEKDGNALAVEYLRAKDLFVQYESLTENDARTLYRQQFPDVEAQLFLWGKITTFKNPKSAEILLKLMDKYNIPPESIQAFLDNPEKYDELFTQKFELEKKTFDLDTHYENYGNTESPLYIPDKPISKMVWEDEMAGNIPAKDYEEWKIYQSLLRPAQKMEAGNIDIALGMVKQSWETHQSDSAWDKEWRGHYEDVIGALNEIKDKKIENYPKQRISGLLQTLYWDIRVDIEEANRLDAEGKHAMAQYYREASKRYSAVAEMLATSIQPDMLLEEYLRQHPNLTIDLRKEARAKLKEDNPNWVADNRRIEAIDHDASPETVEAWADRGKVIDKYGASSAQAKVWLLDHPEVHEWALSNEILSDNGSGWDEDVLRITVAMAGLDEDSTEYDTLKRKREAYTEGFSDYVSEYVAYYDLPVAGYRQERYLLEHPEFAQAMHNIKGLDIPEPQDVPPVKYDELLEKEIKTPQDVKQMEAYDKAIPEEYIEDYVEWYTSDDISRPEGYEGDWYEDDWWLMEHEDFYNEMVGREFWSRKDFSKVPTREVFNLFQVYQRLPLGSARMGYRIENPDLDEWLVLSKGYKPATGVLTEEKKEQLTLDERIAQRLAEMSKGGQLLPVFRG